jgi:hypothetical protein
MITVLSWIPGCRRAEEPGAEEKKSEKPARKETDHGKKEAGSMTRTEYKAAEEDKGWAAEAKEDVVEFAQRQVESLRKNMDQLAKSASEKGSEAEKKWENEIRPRLNEQLQKAEDELEELKKSSGETWGKIKEQARKSISRLKDAYQAAKKELQEDNEK